MSKLFVYPKKEEPFNFILKDKKISIGRSSDNDISIQDPFISSHHAVIYPEGCVFRIRDNSSKNRTFLNGKKIQSEVELKKGDEILVGSTRIVFDMELSTNVDMIDVESSFENINTIMHLDEILTKKEISSTIRPASIPFDLDKIKLEHQAYSIISEVSKALVIHMPLSELLDHIMELISDNLPMDRSVLMLYEGHPPQLIPKVVRINNKNLIDHRIQVSQSIINMAIDDHSAILTSDAMADPRFMGKESVVKLNIHSAMCVPLWDNKEIIGIIYADRISLLEQFSDSDLRLLTLLSNLAAVKIENAKLTEKDIERQKMEKELALAAQIQMGLLPKENPKSEIFEVEGINIPCYQVGGDYYDFIPIGPDHLGITIADVSGKGVSASLLMASLRAALHSEVHPNYKIEEMAAKLNDFVYKSSAPNCFITFFFAEFNEKTGEIKYINAGHNPPFIIGNKKQIKRLESCGFCLGMFPSVIYEAKKTTIDPRDVVILFTDGITEGRNKDNEEYSEERLIELCQKNLKLSAPTLLKKINEQVNAFTSDTDQMDDMTLVVIKRK